MSLRAKNSQNFKNHLSNGFNLRRYRIVLRDALKCRVRLEQLSSDDIGYAFKNGVLPKKQLHNNRLQAHELDHNYSRLKKPSVSLPNICYSNDLLYLKRIWIFFIMFFLS